MDAAMEQDEALKERVEFMKQGASYMRDETERLRRILKMFYFV